MKYLQPRFWPIWCFIGLIHLASLFPFRWQMNLGSLLGKLAKRFGKKRVRIAETNMRLCFPEWSDEQRREMLDRHFESLGRAPFDFGIAAWWRDKQIERLAIIEGLDNMQEALSRGRGAILLAGHFTTLDIAGRIMHLHTEMYPVYRKHNNPLVEEFIGGNRANICGKAISHEDMRSMYKALRDNIPLYYIPDQNFGMRYSIFVPFFGVQTATITATSRLAAKYNTPVVPIVQERLPDYQGYRVKFEKALENFPSDDIVKDATRINRLLEQQVRDNPMDYLWVHRRFKTRPEGEKSLYYD
jgi:KDO2-lipid IV(A) lauroyltransferase